MLIISIKIKDFTENSRKLFPDIKINCDGTVIVPPQSLAERS